MKRINYFYLSGLSTRQFITECKSIISFAKRDSEQLQTVGITAELIAELETSLENLIANVSNAVLAANKKIITAQRDEARLDVLDFIKILRKQLSLVFSEGTKAYDSLFGKRLTGIEFEKFIELSNDIMEVLKQNAQLVSNSGVSALQLTTFEGLVNNMVELHSKANRTKKAFSNDTEVRSDVRKQAYQQAIYIADIARAYWKRKSPATANNYTIRKRSTSRTNSDVLADS